MVQVARILAGALASAAVLTTSTVFAMDDVAYKIYAGSSHAHTIYTASHGEMLDRKDCAGVRSYGPMRDNPELEDWSQEPPRGTSSCYAMFVLKGLQYRTPERKLKSDWQKYQGRPEQHFSAAKAAGFDWYVTSDHSQEAAFFPLGPNNPQWLASKRAAEASIDRDFVGLAGFEYSENNGPDGTGHFNVINTSDISNALLAGVGLAQFYSWLATAKPSGEGPIVVGFNHPRPDDYAGFTGRTEAATEVIALIELINSNSRVHYDGFLAALDAGWKVSPTSGLDNHGLTGIPTLKSRAFVLAAAKTKAALLEGMRKRRTYASLDSNIQARYSVNGAIMGSTLAQPGVFRFDISITDPDSADPRAKITKLDIVSDGGKVVATHGPSTPATTIRWQPTVRDAKAHYFFVRVWSAGGGDSPKSEANQPVAWLAPVWTGIPMAAKPMRAPVEADRARVKAS